MSLFARRRRRRQSRLPYPHFDPPSDTSPFHHPHDTVIDPTRKACSFVYEADYRSWDDWVPENRLRKLSPENRELANNLRHEMLAQQRAARAQTQPVKKKAQGSTRGSEERQTSVAAAAPRGQKRMRDNDLEKVRAPHSPKPQSLHSLHNLYTHLNYEHD